MAAVGAGLFILCLDTRPRAWVRLVEGVDHGGPKTLSDGGRRGLSTDPIVEHLMTPN